MIKQSLNSICVFVLLASFGYGQNESIIGNDEPQVLIVTQDTVSEFIDLLNNLTLNSDNEYFKQHCASILNIIQARELSTYEVNFIIKMFSTFSDTNVPSNASRLTSYTERKRPFIVSWTSPIDSVVSLAWLLLPENWDPELEYPLYVTLHGLFTPYSNPVEYMARYLSPDLVVDKSFADGYSLFPWGRGNIWYEGIGETDVWESIAVAENLVKINSNRKYLVGHSMGGYGAWAIGQNSVSTWAALGIHAGALGYGGNKYLTTTVAEKLKDIPVYFICGTQDGLLGVNQTAFQLLQDAENADIALETFPGGHESLLENWEKMYVWIRNFTNEDGGTGTLNDEILPGQTMLYQNYPNPFNPTTNFQFSISNFQFVVLRVYDVLGREVAIVVNETKEAGIHNVKFDGSILSSGMYLYILQSGNYIQAKKMIIAK